MNKEKIKRIFTNVFIGGGVDGKKIEMNTTNGPMVFKVPVLSHNYHVCRIDEPKDFKDLEFKAEVYTKEKLYISEGKCEIIFYKSTHISFEEAFLKIFEYYGTKAEGQKNGQG